MITERFRDAVKNVVADGTLSSEERLMLENLAKEEGINDLDAQVYVTGELKKVKKQKDNGPDKSIWGAIIATVGTVIVAAAPIIIENLVKKKNSQ